MRIAYCSLLLVFCMSAPPRTHQEGVPAQLTLDGAGTLPLAADARRTHLLGTVEVYNLAIYAAGPSASSGLASTDVAKAVRIEVTWREDLQRRVALDWRRELVPRLEPTAVTHLQGAFAPLRHGDVVLIEYVPDKGTTVRVNRSVAVSRVGHDLMLAFLDHWLGDRPVSESMKQILIGRLQ